MAKKNKRTEQNRICIGVKFIYKGLLPKQHIKIQNKETVKYNQATYICLKRRKKYNG